MKVLITGGTGLIGTEISRQLMEKGHQVVYFSRRAGKNELGIKEFTWDTERGTLDKQAFEGIDVIINLAGAPLNRRWTPEYKSTILRSRVDGTRLLYNTVQKHNIPLKAFISASAVGYYPNDLVREFNEDSPPGNDFLSLVCQKWEQEAQNFESLNIRTVRCRIGLVLSNKGGAFPLIAKSVKFGVGAPLGSGDQWVPWIHLQDLAGIFVFAVENNLEGVYNAAGPYSITNSELTVTTADVLHRPLLIPRIPAFILRLFLGEMAEAALASTKIKSAKIQHAGYRYRFPELRKALEGLLGNGK